MSLARGLISAAISLFLVFSASLLPVLAPVQLLEPKWQQALAGLLIGNGPLALLGLILVCVPDGGGGPGGFRRQATPGWILLLGRSGHPWLPAALPPADIRLVAAPGGESHRNAQQLSSVLARIEQRRQPAASATGPDDLQRRLLAVGSPPLPPGELARPLPQLKAQLLAVLQQAEN